MKNKSIAAFYIPGLAFTLVCSIVSGCRNASSTPTIASHYTYKQPSYANIRIEPLNDTLHFVLNEKTYNAIRVMNYFQYKGVPYLSFYDRGSKSINIYHFESKRLVSRVPLYQWVKTAKLDKAAVYIKNFDSILVTTLNAIYLLDSSGTVKKKIKFYEDEDKKATMTTAAPPVLKEGIFYLSIKPQIASKQLGDFQKWRVLYGFDLENGTRNLYYSLPEIYQKALYAYPYLQYSYCINEKENFVFSFPADSNIYETDLKDYHKAYYSKSLYQTSSILPLPSNKVSSDDEWKQYSLSGTYGAIIYDPFKKRYLRLFKQGLNEADFATNNRMRKKSIIIFNEQFQIIGESEVDDEFLLESVFFTPDGHIYARTNAKDEYALHFVRLAYSYNDTDSTTIGHNSPDKKQ